MNKILSLLAFITLCAACTSEPDMEMEMETPELEERPVLLSLSQTLPVSENNFVLQVTNAEPVSCSNALLQSIYDENVDELNLDIQGYLLPADCDNTMEDIIQDYSLSLTGLEKPFFLTNRASTSEGRIIVSEDEVRFKFVNPEEFTVVDDHIRKIPEGTVWGYTNLTREESEDLETILIPISVDNVPAEIGLAFSAGNYGHFRIDMNPLVDVYEVVEVNGERDFEKGLGFNHPEITLDFIEEIMIEAVQRFPDLSYEFYDSDGSVIRG